MKTAYLITKTSGDTVLLFDRARAHGIAGHYGWTVRQLSAVETKGRIRAALKFAKVA